MNREPLSAARRAEILLVAEWMREHAAHLEKVAARATGLQAEALMPNLVGSLFSMAVTLSHEVSLALCAETFNFTAQRPEPSSLRQGNLTLPGQWQRKPREPKTP